VIRALLLLCAVSLVITAQFVMVGKRVNQFLGKELTVSYGQ